jgi:hypothetical protein
MEEDVWRLLGGGEPGLRERWRNLRAGGGDAEADGPLSMGDLARLRKARGAHVARFASMQDELAGRARRRFPDGRIGFWTGKGLEQSTPAVVADYRAARFASAKANLVWDACCGVGSDAVALLRSGCSVIATDWNGDAARCAAANLSLAKEESGSAGGLFAAMRCDLRRPPLRLEVLGDAHVLLDPDRRPDGEHREPNPELWAPSLSDTLDLAFRARGACVKLPPSLDATASGLDRVRSKPASLEWISLDGEMKELALWTGDLAEGDTEGGVPRRATALMTALPEGDDPTSLGGCSPHRALPAPRPLAEVQAGTWLVELDPTLWQSELAGDFCHRHGLAPIETELRGMFLVASEEPTSPLARSWPILDAVKADRKRVRAALRKHGLGPTTVKKRNHPKSSVQLEAEFKGEGDRRGLLAVFRVPSGSAAVILG